MKLPPAVTLAFTPYGADPGKLVERARSLGHEILLQVPLEPFDYPDNDPGPQTLLTTLSAEQNQDRLLWLLSRFQGYVGLSNFMGARFLPNEASMQPLMREAAKRGLAYFDDGSRGAQPRRPAGAGPGRAVRQGRLDHRRRAERRRDRPRAGAARGDCTPARLCRRRGVGPAAVDRAPERLGQGARRAAASCWFR